jgi:hypothetical protein
MLSHDPLHKNETLNSIPILNKLSENVVVAAEDIDIPARLDFIKLSV